MTAQVTPYLFPGLNPDIKELIAPKSKSKFRANDLQRFIKEYYPHLLTDCRKADIVNERMVIIHTVEKYRHKLFLKDTNDDILSLKVTANNVFQKDHASYIHAKKAYKTRYSHYVSYGLNEDLVKKQESFEKIFLSHFKTDYNNN